MTDIFPQRNLPDQAEAWGREIEDRIKGIEKKVSVVANTTRNTNLVAVKSAEAADHNVRRVEIQVEALEAAVNEKTRAILDEAIEELREAEIVLESQFEAHDTALGEAETAIDSLELATVPETMAAAVGVFIDAMMQNLTVTGVANIHQVVADELYTKMAVVQKLQATESIVTKDMIATGAITSDKIAAGAVTADIVDVGQNAKWDSTGLVFYAPPQPGQAYDDWANRTPLIQIRPDGSSSVQVGDTAGLHGGITSSGLVYGTTGDFETITVGGQDFATAVGEGPRGVISAVTASNGMNATTSNGPYLSTKFAPEPGRMYRITFGFRGGAASTENRLVADFRQARPGASGGGSASRQLISMVMLAARASQGSATGITHIDVSGDYLLGDSTYVTDGETVMWIYIRASDGTFYLNAGNSQLALLPILKIEDIGVAYEVETQTVSSTAPPPPAKVTKTDYIWSGNAVGVRPDGSTALDSRLTLGGYNNFGTDMAEFIWYPFNLSRLNGSTVNEALVQLTITQTYSGGQIAYYMDAATNRLSGRANLSQGWGSPGGSHNRTVPSGNLSRLIGKGGILIAPYNVGQYSSYGYFNSKALLRVKYTK